MIFSTTVIVGTFHLWSALIVAASGVAVGGRGRSLRVDRVIENEADLLVMLRCIGSSDSGDSRIHRVDSCSS
jgi:hypothetical protein